MKITISRTNTDYEVTSRISDDSDIFAVVEELCKLTVMYGFHPDTVRDGIINQAETYEEQK